MNDDVGRTRSLSFTETVESVVGSEGIEHFAAVCEVGLDVEHVWVPVVV